jgi:glutamyl-tRNA synthetase
MLPFHERNDKNSLYEIFSLPQLVQAFDLSHLSRRKAMVNIDKLDFINKMTLRRKAERLGEEGELVNLGKAGENGGTERRMLVERYQTDLRALPALEGV